MVRAFWPQPQSSGRLCPGRTRPGGTTNRRVLFVCVCPCASAQLDRLLSRSNRADCLISCKFTAPQNQKLVGERVFAYDQREIS